MDDEPFLLRIAELAKSGNRLDWNFARMVYADWLMEQGRTREEALTVFRPTLHLGRIESQWREKCRRIIWEAMEDCEVVCAAWTDAERRKYVNARYPFGPRAYLPYKHWLSELKWALAGYPQKARRPTTKHPVAVSGPGLFAEGNA